MGPHTATRTGTSTWSHPAGVRWTGRTAGTRSRRGLLAALAAAVLVAGGCTGPGGDAPAPAGPAGSAGAASGLSFRPGAAGIGDPYYPTYGNGGYDVGDYLIKIKYDPATDKLDGDVTITAVATTDLSRFNLDLSGLTVAGVTVNGAPARARHAAAELVVTPASGLRTGTRFSVRVRYSGVPTGFSDPELGNTGFLHTSDGAVVIGEPESASSWFPVNDHPADKATYTIVASVPDGLSTISNGVLRGTSRSGGWTTTTWRMDAPMASYLATLVIGRYRVKSGTHDGKPVITAVADSLPVGPADAAMARTTEVADFLATRFGPYPFDAYGGIVINDPRVRFALETQTRPVYADSFFARGGDATWVVAHELAHQWYGDSVSLERWSDIWLNEGFATYAQWLWAEHEGMGSVQTSFIRAYTGQNQEFWRIPPGAPGAGHQFSGAVYQRGAMTLQALRLTVGDEAFFRIIRDWASQHRDGNAGTDEFIALAEKVSGRQLDALFQAWLYGSTQPPLPR